MATKIYWEDVVASVCVGALVFILVFISFL